MKTIFPMEERFGPFLSNGDQANAFRFTEVEPALAQGSIVFDFVGVTNMTSSFCNALVATLASRDFREFSEKVRFQNCDPLVREFLRGAVALGRQESAQIA